MDNSTNTTGAAPEPAAAHDTATARAIDAALQDTDAFGAWLEAEADRVEAEADLAAKYACPVTRYLRARTGARALVLLCHSLSFDDPDPHHRTWRWLPPAFDEFLRAYERDGAPGIRFAHYLWRALRARDRR